MKKIIKKSSYLFHQKFVLILFFGITFFIGSLGFLSALFLVFGILEFEGSFSISDYVALLMFPFSLYLLLLLISKEGLVLKNEKMFTSRFLFGIPWKKKEIDIENMTDISILNGDGFQIYLLNETHTTKRLITTIRTEREIAENIVSQIKEEFDFNYGPFNPQFPNKTRRR